MAIHRKSSLSYVGVPKPKVTYWEGQAFLQDMEKRIFLCKLLKIPPLPARADLGKRSRRQKYIDAVNGLRDIAERNLYTLYEDVLTFARTVPTKFQR